MTSTTLAATDRGIWEQTLTANTADQVTFPSRGYDAIDSIRVVNVNGAAALYVTVNGNAPTVGGRDTYWIPGVAGATREIDIGMPASGTATNLVVQVISTAATSYSIEREG